MKKQVIMALFGLTVAQADALSPKDINALYKAANAIEADVDMEEEDTFAAIF